MNGVVIAAWSWESTKCWKLQLRITVEHTARESSKCWKLQTRITVEDTARECSKCWKVQLKIQELQLKIQDEGLCVTVDLIDVSAENFPNVIVLHPQHRFSTIGNNNEICNSHIYPFFLFPAWNIYIEKLKKESTIYPCALDSRGTNLQKTPWEGTLIFVSKLGKDKTKVTACWYDDWQKT